MNWIKRFLGMYDRQQKERATSVSKYVERKKVSFNKEMTEIQRQARRMHVKTRQAHEASAKLAVYVDDVVNKIAIASGGKRVRHG